MTSCGTTTVIATNVYHIKKENLHKIVIAYKKLSAMVQERMLARKIKFKGTVRSFVKIRGHKIGDLLRESRK